MRSTSRRRCTRTCRTAVIRCSCPSDEDQARREAAIGKLSEMFAAQTTKARDLPSFVNRMARKLLAYNFSLMSAQS